MRPPLRCLARATAAVLALLLGLLLGTAVPAAAAQDAPGRGVAVTAGTRDGRSRVVVALPEGALPSGPRAFAVTVDGPPQPVDAVPLLSDTTATAVVVDASAAGAPVLQPGLSGAASFVLAAPPAARSALVADTAPPAVLSPPQVGPADTLRGLAAVRAAGNRQTGVAVELALAQLPRAVDGPHVVLLYTGAPDAMGLPATDLVAHLHAAGAVLAVVVPSADGTVPPYWSAVAAATGGVAVAAREPKVIAAFDAAVTALRTRWLLTFAPPPQLPAVAVVRVDTAAGPVRAAVDVPPPTAASGAASAGAAPGVRVRDANAGLDLVLGLVLAAALVGATVVAVRRGYRRAAGDPATRDPDDRPGRPMDPVVETAWNVPDRLDPVVDRPGLSAALHRALRAGTPVLVAPEPGAVGVGTTTALVELAHRVRRDHDIVWWVPAADPPLVVDRLAELAEVLGLAAPSDPAEEATERLLAALGRRDRWLLIFDDAGSPRQLARFLPPGGRVLIGSNDPEWAPHTTPVAVPPFGRAESTGLLRARRQGLTAAEADRVAAALDDALPAVDLAGATLAETGMSVVTYLQLLDEHRPDPASAPSSGSTSPAGPDPATAAAAVALDRLAADDPSARSLITLLSWLGPDPVPRSLLSGHPDLLPRPLAAGPVRLDDLFATLARRGLVRLDPDSNSADDSDDGAVAAAATVPAVVARVARGTAASGAEGTAASGAEGTADPGGAGWAATAVRLLRAAVPADPADPAARPAWRRLLPHVLAVTDPGRPLDDVLLEVGWLLRHAACYLRERGEQRAAHALFEDAHDLYRRRLGPDHPDTLDAGALAVDSS